MNREAFLTSLHREETLSNSWIEQLKKEKLPLIMWGCGDIGKAIYAYLEKQGILLSGVWSDGASGKEIFKDMVIHDLSGIVEKYSKFNVILGHAYYERGEELYKKVPQIQKIFYAFSISYEQYKRVEYEAIVNEADRFVCLCNCLQDEVSVENLLAYLNTKMTGNVRHIFEVYEKSMSFFENDVFTVRNDEVFLDIGAYTGDTIQLFLKATNGKYKKIIALEPDSSNYLMLCEYLAKERMKNVVASMIGAWNERKDLQFVSGKEQISGVCSEVEQNNTNEVICYADRIDSIFAEEKVSFIKINYFDGVLEAIQGCEGLLRRYHPKLAIVVGFEIYNVLLLFEYISSLNLGYRFYLRFNHAMSSTFTLYIK